MARKLSIATACDMSPSLYPYDVQECHIMISSPGFSMDLLEIFVNKWIRKNGKTLTQEWISEKKLGYNETKLEALQNVFYDANPEWTFLGYQFNDAAITGISGKEYSRVVGTGLISIEDISSIKNIDLS